MLMEVYRHTPWYEVRPMARKPARGPPGRGRVLNSV